jgi:hypothetical protein
MSFTESNTIEQLFFAAATHLGNVGGKEFAA